MYAATFLQTKIMGGGDTVATTWSLCGTSKKGKSSMEWSIMVANLSAREY
jgi:hypothetical protein